MQPVIRNSKILPMKLACLFLTLSILMSSCKKDDQNIKEELISYSWKISSYKLNGVDIFLDDCIKDDCYSFHPDSTYTISNTIKCSTNESDSIHDHSMKWSISEDGTTFYYYFGSDATLEYSIRIRSQKLILNQSDGQNLQEKIYIPC